MCSGFADKLQMKTAREIIRQYSKAGHELGRSITAEEALALIECLRKRFDMHQELDLSPQSLLVLEEKTFQYWKSLERTGFGDQEVVQTIREIVAYIGQVLVMHAEGQWYETSSMVLGTSVKFGGIWEIIKEGRREISSLPVCFGLGFTVTWNWDRIGKGKRPSFYKLYQDAKSRRLEENLVED